MPKFPVIEIQHRLDAPKASAEAFGAATGRAMSQMGNAIGDLGAVIQERRDNDALMEARKDVSRLELEIAKDTLEIRQSAAPGGDGHIDRINEMLTQRWDEVSSKYTGKAQQYLEEQRQKSMLAHVPGEMEFQAKAKGVQIVQDEKAIADEEIKAAYQNPEMLPQLMASKDQRIDGYSHHLSPEAITELKRGQNQALTQAHYQGLIERSTSPEEAMAIRDEMLTGEASALRRYENAVIQMESGGDPTASSSTSTAAGPAGFLAGTWIGLIAQYHPELMEGRTPDEVLALRSDVDLSREMLSRFSEQNAASLRNSGLPITPMTLYAAHHFGAQGAKGFLRANPSTSVEAILGKTVVDANPYLKGKTVGQVQQTILTKLRKAGSPSVEQDLDPNDMVSLVSRANTKIGSLQSAANAQAKIYQDRMKSATEDHIQFLRDGNVAPRPGGMDNESLVSVLGEKAGPLITELEFAETVAPYAKIVSSGPLPQAEAVVRQWLKPATSEDYKERKKIADVLSGVLTKRKNELEDDSVKYTQEHSDLVKQEMSKMAVYGDEIPLSAYASYYDALIIGQRQWGVLPRDIRLLDDKEIAVFADLYKQGDKAGTKLSDELIGLKARTGIYYDMAVRDLVNANAVPPGTSVLADAISTDDMKLRQILPVAMANMKQIVKDNDYKQDEYSTAIELREYAQSLGNPSNTQGYFNDINEIKAATDALSAFYKAAGDSDHKETAVNMVLGKYTFSGTTRVPKGEVVTASQVEDRLPGITLEFDRDYGDQIDWSLVKGEGTPEENRKNVIASLHAGLMEHYTSMDNTGIYFMTNNGATLKNKNGSIFVIPWEDFSMVTPEDIPEDSFWLDY